MKEIRWSDKKICQYVFIEDEHKPVMDVNITALINGESALLIDTAFSRHAEKVKNDLESKGITVDEIILSHYHPDHAAGATSIPNATLSGSVHCKNNYENCNDFWDREHDYREPQKVISNGNTRSYGEFTIKFFETPGHSKCSLVTLIDNRVAHIGDLLMFDVDEKPVLPLICEDGRCEEHLESLKMLKELNAEVLIPGHGKEIVGKDAIENEIDKRIKYLEVIIESGGKAKLEEALNEEADKWAFTGAHEANSLRL